MCHLVEELELPQPLVSHHLKVLREVGAVESERFRQWTYYRIVPDVFASLTHDLAAIARNTYPPGARRRPCC